MGKKYIITENQERILFEQIKKRKKTDNENAWTSEKQKAWDDKLKELEVRDNATLTQLENERKSKAEEANKLSVQLQQLISKGAPVSQIKELEYNITLLQRDSYSKVLSPNEWNLLNQKSTKLYQEFQDAQQLEREERRKKEEIKRAEEYAQEKFRQEEEEERKRKLNLPLQKFVGKSVNFYNDKSQQILYGKDTIRKMEFDNSSKFGGRSGIFIYTEDGLEYEIICLSNPDRLADYIVLHKEYTKDYKYNSSFVNAVKQVVPNFCKKPKADFSAVRKQTNNKTA